MKQVSPTTFIKTALGSHYVVLITNQTWIGHKNIIKPRTRSSLAELSLQATIHDPSSLPNETVEIGSKKMLMAEYVRLMLGTAAESKSIAIVITPGNTQGSNQQVARDLIFSSLRSITAREIDKRLREAAMQFSFTASKAGIGKVSLQYKVTKRVGFLKSSRYPALSNNEFIISFIVKS